MRPNRRKLVRRSFMALVTGTSVFALQACGSDNAQDPGGNNSAQPDKSESGSGGSGGSDSDSGS